MYAAPTRVVLNCAVVSSSPSRRIGLYAVAANRYLGKPGWDSGVAVQSLLCFSTTPPSVGPLLALCAYLPNFCWIDQDCKIRRIHSGWL